MLRGLLSPFSDINKKLTDQVRLKTKSQRKATSLYTQDVRSLRLEVC